MLCLVLRHCLSLAFFIFRIVLRTRQKINIKLVFITFYFFRRTPGVICWSIAVKNSKCKLLEVESYSALDRLRFKFRA